MSGRDRQPSDPSGAPADAGTAVGLAAGRARAAGGWPVTRAAAADPWDELDRQAEIHAAALALVDAARDALIVLARRSQDHRRQVACDQEDWPAVIGDCLDDMVGDTFGCLPEAIARARRELAAGEPD